MTLHRHHIQTRARGGPDVPENILLICPVHHEWLHRHQNEAHRLGWLRHSWEEMPEEGWTPSALRVGWNAPPDIKLPAVC